MSYPPSPVKDLKLVAPIPIDLDSIEQDPVSDDFTELPKPWSRKALNVLGSVQKYSAYSFGTFLGIHVTSVIVVPVIPLISSAVKQEVFEMARSVYHSIPYVESIFILGAVGVHIASGIGIRFLRNRLRQQKKVTNGMESSFSQALKEPVIKDDTRDDIGLGGITGLLGLGYKKSWISTLIPGLSPLSFSGYVLIPLSAFHFTKFRYLPISTDGDSSLINLDYITYYLNHSVKYLGNAFNFAALALLVWVMMYHSVSGTLRINRKFSLAWKRFGYTLINGVTALGLVSIILFKRNVSVIDSHGFVGKTFFKYLNAFWV